MVVNRSGLEMYSDEWMRENATDVPVEFWEPVRELCLGYQLGNSADPNLIWNTIKDALIKDGVSDISLLYKGRRKSITQIRYINLENVKQTNQ